ncbi:MAG: arginine--tRNA ligase [Chitinivibrionales bacterium]|nr:arginine--tRNA ligase [Chitinivibrionales bacterium]
MQSVRSYLRGALYRAAAAAVPDVNLSEEEIVLERPKKASFGDISTPLALYLARQLKKAPPVIARSILGHLEWDERYIACDAPLESTLVGGFLNFRISTSYLYATLRQVFEDQHSFGRNQCTEPRTILMEFVSANPTGPMVVVNGRAAAIGDALARIHAWIGNNVATEYYVNDCGNQIELLGKSVACRYFQAQGRAAQLPEGGYAGEYIADLAREIAAEHPEMAEFADDEVVEFCKREALRKNVASQKRVLSDYGVKYTNWFHESELHASGKVYEALDTLAQKNLVYEHEAAQWFKSSEYGDEKDRVLVRGDDSPTYFLADLAYHAHKADRGFDESYTFWGPDHHGYLPRLEAAVGVLNPGKTAFHNFIIQQVNLLRDGKPFRMSKRRGDFVTISDLVNEVGVDAARYFFLMRKLSSHFDFDLGLAVKKSEENPVFYVQYAHARTCSLIRHALELNFRIDEIEQANLVLLNEPEELDVLRLIAEFPHLLVHVAENAESQRITAYLENLASVFHHFYQKHRIVTGNKALSCARLYLACGIRNLLKVALDLLGVSAPEKM